MPEEGGPGNRLNRLPDGPSRTECQVARSPNGSLRPLELHLARCAAFGPEEALGLRCIAGLIATHLRLLITAAPVNGAKKARLAAAAHRRFAAVATAIAERYETLCTAQATLEATRGAPDEDDARRARDAAEREFEEAFSELGRLL